MRPSEFIGTRRKVALRREAYALAPILRSFDKLCDAGVLYYLVLNFFFKVFYDVSVGLRP